MPENNDKDRIAALEAELIRYAAKYGLTDEARHLLTQPLPDSKQEQN